MAKRYEYLTSVSGKYKGGEPFVGRLLLERNAPIDSGMAIRTIEQDLANDSHLAELCIHSFQLLREYETEGEG